MLKEQNLGSHSAPDEDAKLVAVEILVVLRQSTGYVEWSKRLAQLPPANAISSAVHLGWLLREAVESNWWDSLPRASDPEFTKMLRELTPRDLWIVSRLSIALGVEPWVTNVCARFAGPQSKRCWGCRLTSDQNKRTAVLTSLTLLSKVSSVVTIWNEGPAVRCPFVEINPR